MLAGVVDQQTVLPKPGESVAERQAARAAEAAAAAKAAADVAAAEAVCTGAFICSFTAVRLSSGEIQMLHFCFFAFFFSFLLSGGCS